jgi:hypothetical protein
LPGVAAALRLLPLLLLNSLAAAVDYALKKCSAILRMSTPASFQVEGLKDLLEESFAVLSDSSRLMEPGQLNPLLGKLQQIRQKYSAAYYHAHQALRQR